MPPQTAAHDDNDGDDNFDKAVTSLYSHQSKTLGTLLSSAQRRKNTISEMHEYLSITSSKIDTATSPPPFHLIHITGTKGKGSTAKMCETILREVYGLHTGLFTSPHLVDVRERIRLDGKRVEKDVFAESYFALRERLLGAAASREDDDDGLPALPGYFRMMTLLALDIFTRYVFEDGRRVDVVILEVGMGGRYDATNILIKNNSAASKFVCGVTLIDYDHQRVLGDTLPEIAWEKGGIFRHVPCSQEKEEYPTFFTIDQNGEEVRDILRQCTTEADTGDGVVANHQPLPQLEVVHSNQMIHPSWTVGVQGEHQRLNAELAVAMCTSLIHQIQKGSQLESLQGTSTLQQALENVRWPGRCHTLTYSNSNVQVHCDGAHTEISLTKGLEWFLNSTPARKNADEGNRILIFNCSHERNPVQLLQILLAGKFNQVFFCRANSERPSMISKSNASLLLSEAGVDIVPLETDTKEEEGTWQATLCVIWRSLQYSLNKQSDYFMNMTVKDALDHIVKNHGDEDPIDVFVTGSLYIVGSALSACDWKDEECLSGSLK